MAIEMDEFRKLLAAVKINRDYDIPYLAGYTKDDKTVYIDRSMPKGFEYKGRFVETDRFLAVHEVYEDMLEQQNGKKYLAAHRAAIKVERSYVEAAGVSWSAYDWFMQKQIKRIARKKVEKIPKNLDLQPYKDEHDHRYCRLNNMEHDRALSSKN